MTDPVTKQSDILTKTLKQMKLMEDRSKKIEFQAGRLTRQFHKLDLGLQTGAGSGADLFDRLGFGLKQTETALADLAGTGRRAAGDIRGAFEGAFQKLLLEGKSFKSVLASLETDLLRLGSRMVGDGLAAARQGLVSQIFPGFSSGGSFTVGGAAGVDRNLVGLRLTRGEKVTVETPTQARQSRGRGDAGGNIALTFHITTPDADSFRRSQAQIQGDALRQAQRQLQRNG